MRHHAFITLGLVMLGIFLWRAVDALGRPGTGLEEVYIAGGVVLAGALIASGLRGLIAARRASRDGPEPTTGHDHG